MLKVAWKSLLGRKLRLLLSTFAIVLGVAFVAGSFIFTDTLGRSFTAIFASTVGDVIVQPEGSTTVDGTPSSRTVPASLVPELEQVDGAARVDGMVSAFGVFVIDTDGDVIGGQGAPGIGGNWSDAPAGHGISGLQITEGHEPSGPDQVVMDEGTAEAAGYQVGDTVTVIMPTDPPLVEPTLVGVAAFPDGGSLNGASFVAWDTATSQDLFLDGEDVFSTIWVTAEDGVSQDRLNESVDAMLPDGVEAVTGDEAADEIGNQIQDALGFLTTFLLIFAGISLVVGAFLIVNTFSILVAQRSRELALLRALGASKRQVTRSVLLEALVLGVLGSTLGLGLGVLLAMAIRAIFATVGLDLSGQPLVFAPRTVLASYVVGVAVTMVAAYFPARRTSRIAPVQALRDDVALPETTLRRRMVAGTLLVLAGAAAMLAGLFVDVPRPGWFVGLGTLLVLLGVATVSPVISRPFLAGVRAVYARVFGTVGHLAGVNALRNPRRTAATASALMIGLALACTMAIVGDSAKSSVDKTIADNFVGDYVVSNLFAQGFSPAIARQMEQVDGVDSVHRLRFGVGEVDGEQEGLAALDPDLVDSTLVAADGSLDDLADGTVAVEEQYAADRGLTVGDTLVITVPAGTTSLPIVATFEENPLLSFPALTTFETLSESGFPEQDNVLIVDVADAGGGVQQRLENVVADLPIISVKDQDAFAAEQREPIDQLVLMIFALLGLALVIAVLGIVNTLALSIVERTREVGLLRAIGLGRGQLRAMITLESVVIAFLGALLGVAMGVVFGLVLMYSLREEGLEVISVPVAQLVAFLLVSLVVGVLAAVLPARRAARLDVLQAIATE